MNKLIIIGNLTRDPESRTTQSGKTVCSFTVAVNRRDGKTADFFRVSAWSQLGENCQRYLAKGRKVAVSGRVSVSTYQASDGTTKANIEVMAEDVEFLTAKGEQAEKPVQQAVKAEPAQGYTDVTDDEDLPF